MNTGIHVGNKIDDRRSIEFITNALLKILDTSAGDAVKNKAIEALSAAFQVNNTVISGCSIYGQRDDGKGDDENKD